MTPPGSCSAASFLVSSHVKFISVSLQVCRGGHSGPSIIPRKPLSIINTVIVGGGGGINGAEMVHYPSARSLLSFCVRMSPCRFCCAVYRKNTEQCRSTVGSQRPPATSACPGIISPQVKSVKGTLFSVVGTKNMTERRVTFISSSACASAHTLTPTDDVLSERPH